MIKLEVFFNNKDNIILFTNDMSEAISTKNSYLEDEEVDRVKIINGKTEIFYKGVKDA